MSNYTGLTSSEIGGSAPTLPILTGATLDKASIRFYLTSSEPFLTQTVPYESIGGYLSSTEISLSDLLLTGINPSTLTFQNQTVSPTRALVNNELITVSSNVVTSLVTSTIGKRAFTETDTGLHIAGNRVYNVSKNILNNSFNDSKKQYRCFAVKNEGSVTFNNVGFYFKKTSANANCTVKLAVEVPSGDIRTGTATKGTTISIVDSSLIGVDENEYVDSVVTVTSGSNINQARKIASVDNTTGTITYLTAMPFAIVAGVTYRIENSPAQRVVSGLVQPATNTYISSFSTAIGSSNKISINRGGRSNGASLLPYEVVYLWIERLVDDNVDTFIDNRVIFTMSYST